MTLIFYVLGFLNANTDGKSRHPSNLGILDQIAALHWVQENIGESYESFVHKRALVKYQSQSEVIKVML